MKRKFFYGHFYIFLIFSILVVAQNLFPQVVIKERVEIKPSSNPLLKPMTQHLIRVDLQWTPADIPVAIRRVNQHSWDTCNIFGGTGYQTGGSISYEVIDLMGGAYTFEISANYSPPCEIATNINGQSFIYYDNNLISSYSFTSLSYCYVISVLTYVGITSPLITDYQFNINSEEMCIGNDVSMNFDLGLGCTNIEIDTSTENINLQIISGGEYASFYKYDELQGDSVEVPFSNIESIELKQDELNPGDETFVIVQSNLGGLIKQDSIKIYAKNDLEFIVFYNPDPIKTNQINDMEIYLTCLDEYLAILPEDITLKAEIIKGNHLGYLEDFDNGQTGQVLTDIPFLPFDGNFIGFIGNGIKITDMDTAIVRIKTSSPEIDSIDIPLIFTPGNLIIIIQPDTLEPGEIATITVKERLDDGTIANFPTDQRFEIGMLEGCVLGTITADGDTSQYLYNVSQPMTFLADTTEGNSGVVNLRIGVIEQGSSSSPVGGGNLNYVNENMRAENPNDVHAIHEAKINKERKQNLLRKNSIVGERTVGDKGIESVNGGPPSDNPTTYCFYEPFSSSKFEEATVVVGGDECVEEIVVCNNYTPPVFENISSIRVLGENEPWQWTDDQGITHNTNTGTACDYQIDPNEVGKTYIMSRIGDFATGQPVYNLLDDMKATVCLDENDPADPIWRYSVENMMVPIFTAHCPARPIANGFVDLGDGTSAALLTDNIKNCADYTYVMETLTWWKKGPYWQVGQSPPHMFYFSAGTIAHENVHVQQLRDGGTKAFPIASISKEMNGRKGLPALIKYIYSAIVAKCPEDALNAPQGGGFGNMKGRVKAQFNAALSDANNLERRGGYDGQLRARSELEADELARPVYDEIKKNIENWAKQQSWWCIPWPIIGEDYYSGCDNSDCTP